VGTLDAQQKYFSKIGNFLTNHFWQMEEVFGSNYHL
jgi:hypothetical protein